MDAVAQCGPLHRDRGQTALRLSWPAEGDRVAVEAESHGELKNGKTYNNTYHFLFVFRDGKIRRDEAVAQRAVAREVLKTLPVLEE